MQILAAGAAPAGGNLFSSPPPNPRINEPLPHTPPPLPVPRRKSSSFPKKSPPPPNPALKTTHNRTRYYKPVPRNGGVISSSGDRSVIVGESGVSYLLPEAPFEFQFSYSETPKARPLAIREPAFLPFAPPTMPRPWTGKGPLLSKKEKERKKKIRLFEPLDGRPEAGRVFEMARSPGQLGRYSKAGMSREEVLGEPLSRAEVRELVKPNMSHNRQVNLGRDGLTHNMLELVHTHWRRQEVCKVRCRGVPTVDMDNVCHHLEEKTGGKIIYRIGGLVYLFRGRNYNPHTRPKYPVMLWKPAAPVYPKLIQEAPEGLTKAEADEMRKKGQSLLPICKLAKNGIYLTLVKDVRDAFEGSHLAKINCEGMHASDYKKIGAKLKELVPCVLLSFDNEQILMWRGNDWKSMYPPVYPSVSKLLTRDKNVTSDLKSPGTKTEIPNSRMMKLWKHAVDSGKAMVLDEPELSPDSILERVEEFEGVSQASEHSYPALILSGEGESDDSVAGYEDRSEIEFGIGDFSSSDSEDSEDYDDEGDLLEEVESSVPIGSLPVDSIAERLGQEW